MEAQTEFIRCKYCKVYFRFEIPGDMKKRRALRMLICPRCGNEVYLRKRDFNGK